MLGKSLKQTRKAKQLQQNSKISWFAVGNQNKNGQIKIISSMDLFWGQSIENVGKTVAEIFLQKRKNI